MRRRPIDRRAFLRCATHALALPALASWGWPTPRPAVAPARRLVCAGALLGFHGPAFFHGSDPVLTRPLVAAGLEGRFTTVSGLDHAGPVGGGHDHAHRLFTGLLRDGVSLDQVAAEALDAPTRYASLQLAAGRSQTRPTLAFNRGGVPLPAVIDPERVHAALFGEGPAVQARAAARLDAGASLLDDLLDEARRTASGLGVDDRRTLEHFLEAVRGAELQLARRRDWADRPFPDVPVGWRTPERDAVEGARLLETEDLMWDLAALALQTDATRVLSLCIPITFDALRLDGQTMGVGYHALTHHGGDPRRIEQLLRIERHHLRGAARFLGSLAACPDPAGGSLLDSTVLVLGAAMGDASTHRRRNFPLLVAGGPLRHRGHLACGGEDAPNVRACDLFVTVLRALGLDVERFGSSEGDLDARLL